MGAVSGLVGGLLVVLWVRATGRPWSVIGYVRPRHWGWTAAAGVAFGVALKLLLKSVILPLVGAPATNSTYHDLVGNTAALPGVLLSVILFAGVGEETLWRGYVFERSAAWFGCGALARVATVLVSAALFALAHLHDQGWPGVEQAAVTGLVFGAIYARTGTLPFLMFAHAAYDVAAVAIIYLGLELPVAHLLFR